MIYQNMEFHNVWEMTNYDNVPGLWLHRYPESVRLSSNFNEGAKHVSQTAVGAECRFVCDDADFIRLSVSSVESDSMMQIYFGDYHSETHTIEEGKITSIMIKRPSNFQYVKGEDLDKNARYTHNVIRVVFYGYILFHRLESFGHEVRPPKEGEVPKKKWLAYGSSITMTNRPISYANLTAKRLFVDVLNLGLAGSCRLENDAADFIAERGDWDFATLELGVNVRGLFDEVEFKKRAEYMIKTITEKNPNKHVGVITIFPNTSTLSVNRKEDDREFLFNQALRDIVADINSEYLHLIEGKDILTQFSGLSADLIHPWDNGHIEMSENLSRIMREKFAL